jgi:Protein of unknown function (DUF2950)
MSLWVMLYRFGAKTGPARIVNADGALKVENRPMITGFALVDRPTDWADTGVMSFIVNQQARVIKRTLASTTAKNATVTAPGDPDGIWTILQADGKPCRWVDNRRPVFSSQTACSSKNKGRTFVRPCW